MRIDRAKLNRTFADVAGKPAPPKVEERLNAYLRREALDLGDGLRLWDSVTKVGLVRYWSQTVMDISPFIHYGTVGLCVLWALMRLSAIGEQLPPVKAREVSIGLPIPYEGGDV